MTAAPALAHLDETGRARMVDVGAKMRSARFARAEALVEVGPEIARQLEATGGVAKGNVLDTARLAGILAAKRTGELIPMCHTLELDVVDVTCELRQTAIVITASARCQGRTGVEMEAMTAAAIAALTVYDMCKSAGKGIVIRQVRLLEKAGGKSGHWGPDGEAAGKDEG